MSFHKTALRALYRAAERRFAGLGLGRYRLLDGLAKAVVAHLRSPQVDIGGHRMLLDPLDSLRLSINGVYEEFETHLVEQFVQEGDLVVDVGAHVGYYTLIFARLVGPSGRVVSFEPEPDNFRLLKKNVEANGYENVTLVPKAVSNSTGRGHLQLDAKNTGGHRLVERTDAVDSVEIDSVRLDDFLQEEHRAASLIKMDIEGGEVEALRGMGKILARSPEVRILTEFNPMSLERAGCRPSELLRALRELGLKVYQVDRKMRRLKLVEGDDSLAEYSAEKQNHTNLLCSRVAIT